LRGSRALRILRHDGAYNRIWQHHLSFRSKLRQRYFGFCCLLDGRCPNKSRHPLRVISCPRDFAQKRGIQQIAALTDIILKERGCARCTDATITLTEGGKVMEFNVFEYFKDYKRITKGPMTPEEQGTSLFLAGNMGERIREFADIYAE